MKATASSMAGGFSGSADMLQTLFKYDLVNALELMIIPITLGAGKRLFQDGTVPAAFRVTESQITPNGIIIVNYERNGDERRNSLINVPFKTSPIGIGGFDTSCSTNHLT